VQLSTLAPAAANWFYFPHSAVQIAVTCCHAATYTGNCNLRDTIGRCSLSLFRTSRDSMAQTTS